MGKDNDNLIRKSIVEQGEFSIKKKFSQNFLLDENIINKIIDSANIDDLTGVIEIGPGLGALTKKLVKKANKLLIYEIDKDLIPYLEEFLKDYKNIFLLNKDILKTDVNLDIKTYLKGVKRIVVISNLPYHITTPIIMKFLEEVNNINSMILMMQQEVAKRITSQPNTKDYNALSVVIQHQAKAKYLFKVSKNVFYPQPKVDSAVIKLDIISQTNNENNKEFYNFVHQCFSQRRKTLVNNISNGYSLYSKEELMSILEELGLHSMVRAEALKLDHFIILYKKYFQKNGGK